MKDLLHGSFSFVGSMTKKYLSEGPEG
jgi:hypothetical protein